MTTPQAPTQPAGPAQPTPAKTSRGLQWPAMIIGLLGLNVGICAVTIISAARHPAHIEPDYYERAVNWDQIRAEQAKTTSTPATAPASTETTHTD